MMMMMIIIIIIIIKRCLLWKGIPSFPRSQLRSSHITSCSVQ